MARGGLASVDAAVTDHRAEKLGRLGLDRSVVGHLSPLQAQVSPLASARTLDAPARKLGEHGVALYTEPASPTSWTPLSFQPRSRRKVTASPSTLSSTRNLAPLRPQSGGRGDLALGHIQRLACHYDSFRRLASWTLYTSRLSKEMHSTARCSGPSGNECPPGFLMPRTAPSNSCIIPSCSSRSVWSDRSLNAKTGALRENTALTSGAPSRSWRPDPPCHRRGRATPRLKHALQTHRAGRTRSESDRVVRIAGGENLGTFAAAPRERKLHRRFATESHCEPHTDAVL